MSKKIGLEQAVALLKVYIGEEGLRLMDELRTDAWCMKRAERRWMSEPQSRKYPRTLLSGVVGDRNWLMPEERHALLYDILNKLPAAYIDPEEWRLLGV